MMVRWRPLQLCGLDYDISESGPGSGGAPALNPYGIINKKGAFSWESQITDYTKAHELS